VELPDVELLTLARTPGVQILEVTGDEAPEVAPFRRRLSKAP